MQVNRSLHFKDPETGAHTRSIESTWRAAKTTLSSSGRRKAHIPGNLARYLLNKRCEDLQLDRMEEFLRIAGQLYDPTKSTERKKVADDEYEEEDELPF